MRGVVRVRGVVREGGSACEWVVCVRGVVREGGSACEWVVCVRGVVCVTGWGSM